MSDDTRPEIAMLRDVSAELRRAAEASRAGAARLDATLAALRRSLAE